MKKRITIKLLDLMCKLGFHGWIYTSKVENENNYNVRMCIHCDKLEEFIDYKWIEKKYEV